MFARRLLDVIIVRIRMLKMKVMAASLGNLSYPFDSYILTVHHWSYATYSELGIGYYDRNEANWYQTVPFVLSQKVVRRFWWCTKFTQWEKHWRQLLCWHIDLWYPSFTSISLKLFESNYKERFTKTISGFIDNYGSSYFHEINFWKLILQNFIIVEDSKVSNNRFLAGASLNCFHIRRAHCSLSFTKQSAATSLILLERTFTQQTEISWLLTKIRE